MSLTYRRDIDGLRAVAVLPVILFHGGFGPFAGGFVGVDVFFVISGYLITTIIINELDESRFSLLTFYERRARRILPALIFVVLCTSALAWKVLLPADMNEFADSLIAVATFSSNFFFWLQSSYFSTNAELKPLLHTWSLAVEEQFYILAPLLLMALWGHGRALILWFLAASFMLSLGLAQWGAFSRPSATFFLLPTRAWELMIGAFAAFFLQRRRISAPKRVCNAYSAAGLGAILVAVFVFDAQTPFPSLYALVPTLGTVAIILFAQPGTWVRALLSMRLFVGVGLISYSLYLWHQPLFALWRHYNHETLTTEAAVLLVCVTFAFGYVTYLFVETPFRGRQGGIVQSQAHLLGISGAALAALAALGLAGHVTQGGHYRLTEHQRRIMTLGAPVSFPCPDMGPCLLGAVGEASPDIALVGDSHLNRYAALIDEHFRQNARSGYQVSNGWCAPLFDFNTLVPDRCGLGLRERFEAGFREVLKDPNVHTVILAGEWANYTTGHRHLYAEIAYDFGGDERVNRDPAANPREFRMSLAHTLNLLSQADKRVILVGPVPEYAFRVPAELLRADWNGQGAEFLAQSRDDYDARNRDVLATFEVEDARIDYVDPTTILCDAETCRPYTDEGIPMYSDGNHLARAGLERVVPLILERLEPR